MTINNVEDMITDNEKMPYEGPALEVIFLTPETQILANSPGAFSISDVEEDTDDNTFFGF